MAGGKCRLMNCKERKDVVKYSMNLLPGMSPKEGEIYG